MAVEAMTSALDAALVAGALSLEAFRANLSPLDPDLRRLGAWRGTLPV